MQCQDYQQLLVDAPQHKQLRGFPRELEQLRADLVEQISILQILHGFLKD